MQFFVWYSVPSGCSNVFPKEDSNCRHSSFRECRSCLFSRGRGCRSALTRVPLRTDERRPSLILRTAAKHVTVYIFLDTKSHLTFLPYLDMIVWSQLYYRLAWKMPFEGSCFEFFLSKRNIFAHARKYQLFGEPYRLFSRSFTRISNIVLGLKTCFNSNRPTVECHFDLPPGFYVIYVKYTLKHRAL